MKLALFLIISFNTVSRYFLPDRQVPDVSAASRQIGKRERSCIHMGSC
jgi:hypothetical protein